ncbi:hypothetical protein FN846DRAFT_913388 [Sphaerosporella brunnea]|uniref:Uncharacterized protein n=1 Tax=Sphaerosporella brunnea TaxID=1250544 RepID=A0A5J5EGD7_9PEZI|nr:hypothetical protein FN846DRAFT_913388 [Sphaerosporella brunnea]
MTFRMISATSLLISLAVALVTVAAPTCDPNVLLTCPVPAPTYQLTGIMNCASAVYQVTGIINGPTDEPTASAASAAPTSAPSAVSTSFLTKILNAVNPFTEVANATKMAEPAIEAVMGGALGVVSGVFLVILAIIAFNYHVPMLDKFSDEQVDRLITYHIRLGRMQYVNAWLGGSRCLGVLGVVWILIFVNIAIFIRASWLDDTKVSLSSNVTVPDVEAGAASKKDKGKGKGKK